MIKGIHHISMKCGTTEELAKVREFYIELLGLKIIREWAEGMMIDRDILTEWYFSVVDVVGVLTESPNPNNYRKVLKNRLKKEGSQLVSNTNQLITNCYKFNN